MGNTQAATNENRMAIAAMANIMKITRKDILNLREKCMLVARTGIGDYPELNTIKRSDFLVAMAELGISHNDLSAAPGSNDEEVIDRLFTMFDNSGDDRIDPMLFLSAISPLSSISGVNNKLLFAFQVYDVENSGILKNIEVIAVLSSINDCASYFGDAVLSTGQVQKIVNDTFTALSLIGEVEYAKGNFVETIVSHPFTVQFLSGQGTARYGTK